MSSRRKLERLFNLFRNGYNVAEVAYKLGITFKEVQQLKRIYVQNEEISEKIKRSNSEITDYYEKEMEKQEHEEIAERLIKTVKEQRKNGLDYSDIESRRELILGHLTDVQEIFFLGSNGGFLARWVLEKEFLEQSPLFSALRFRHCLN